MYECYNLKADDFFNASSAEYLIIIKSEISDFNVFAFGDLFYEFTLDDFQRFAEHSRFCLGFHDIMLDEVKHYDRKPISKIEFANEYNKHLKCIKLDLIKNLKPILESEIEECYILNCYILGGEYWSIFAIAKMENGYLAFHYACTA